MGLKLVSINARGLRSPSKRKHLLERLKSREVDICCIQETRFDSNFRESILSEVYEPFSACFDGRSRGVSWLFSRNLHASCSLVFSDPTGRLCVVDATIEGRAFRFIGVYGPNATSELPDFFRRIEPYVTSSRRVVLTGDWNAVLDPRVDRGEGSRATNNLDAKHFRDFVERFDLVDKHREEHPDKVEWTWTGRGASGRQLSSYIDRVLVRRVDVDFIEGPSFESIEGSDHRMIYVGLNLDRIKVRRSGYWKLNASLLEDKEFISQLELTVKRELTGAVIGNRWWGRLKDRIRSFATDYSRRLKLDKLAEQRLLEDRIDRAVREGDSIATNIARAELALSNNKKYQAQVVRARLKRMSCEAANMARELRAEELRAANHRQIASVTSPDGHRRITNKDICKEFCDYYQKLFTREPGLSSAQFDTYLADFPRLEDTEAAGCEGRITEEEIWQALKSVGLEKTPGIDGLPYEVYLRLSPMLVPLLETIYNNWMRQGSIPRRFTQGVVKLLCKNKRGGDGISNFRPLTMLNTDLKILAKILADRLQTALPSLIAPEQSCAVKGRTIQDSLHMIRTIVEKVDKAALINLDQSKAFDRVDHGFLEAVLSAAGFGVTFRSWIRLLYASPGVMVEVNGVRSKPFSLSRSIRQGCPLSPLLYILALEPFLCKLRANPVLCGVTLTGAVNTVKYTAYADDVTIFVTSRAEAEQVSIEIGKYEMVTGARINRDKSVGLRLGAWKGCALPGPFSWTDGPCKILGVWFGPDLQLEKNWSEILEKVVATAGLWSRRRLSLKGRAEVCISYIYPLILYRLSVLPIPSTLLIQLERALFQFIWGKRAPMVRRDICCLHPSEGGLGVPSVETRRHTLRLRFLGRAISEHDESGEFWKEDAKKAFPALRSVHSENGEAYRLPRKECSFYRECRYALKVLSRLQLGLTADRPPSRKALYQMLVRGAVRDDLIGKLGLTKAEGRLLWPWAPGLRSLNNDEASLTWLVIRGALWVGKRLKKAGLATPPVCVRCRGEEESLVHAFFTCPVVKPLLKLLEGFMVRMQNGKSFTLDVRAVLNNVVTSLDRNKLYVLLCLLGVVRVVIWTTRKEEHYGGESFSSQALVAFYKHQIKVKIRSERKRLSSLVFNERWVKLSRLCRVKGADLEFMLETVGT